MPERRVSYEVRAQGQLSGLEISAPSWQRLFVDSGLAINDYRISLDLVKDVSKETISVSGTSLQDLMLHWLNAVIAIFNQKKFLAHRIVFTVFDGKKIEATLTGETYETPRHGYARPFEKVAPSGFKMETGESEFSVTFFLA